MNNEETISRAGTYDLFSDTFDGMELITLQNALELIDAAPSVPPQVVHGHWAWNPDHCKWGCSVCGGMEGECESPICKWCGAKMDGGEDDAN